MPLALAVVLAVALAEPPTAVGERLGAGERPDPPPAAEPRPAGPPHRLCYRGRPADECRAFVLTEIELSTPAFSNHGIAGGGTSVPLDTTLLLKAGPMVNVGPRSAVGLALVLAYTGFGRHSGLEARYRHWLRRHLALDLGAGVLRVDDGRGYQSPWEGRTSFDLSVALNLADAIALSVSVHAIKLPPSFWDVTVYPGIRLESWSAAIGGTAATLLMFLAVAGSAS